MCVAKQDGEDYELFIKRVASNEYAKAVKIAELESNMNITRLKEITDKDVMRLRKYLKAYRFLIS